VIIIVLASPRGGHVYVRIVVLVCPNGPKCTHDKTVCGLPLSLLGTTLSSLLQLLQDICKNWNGTRFATPFAGLGGAVLLGTGIAAFVGGSILNKFQVIIFGIKADGSLLFQTCYKLESCAIIRKFRGTKISCLSRSN